MKTLIINGSPRKNGETAILISELKKRLNGEVTVIDTYYAGISPCVDCRHCWTHPKCAIDDGMQDAYRMIDEADNVIIASPIYFGLLTGPLLSWASRLQYFWCSKKFRNETVLQEKKRVGALLLTDGGDGYKDEALVIARRLFRHLGAEFKDYAYFSGTDYTGPTVPKEGDPVMIDLCRIAHMMNKSVEN